MQMYENVEQGAPGLAEFGRCIGSNLADRTFIISILILMNLIPLELSVRLVHRNRHPVGVVFIIRSLLSSSSTFLSRILHLHSHLILSCCGRPIDIRLSRYLFPTPQIGTPSPLFNEFHFLSAKHHLRSGFPRGSLSRHHVFTNSPLEGDRRPKFDGDVPRTTSFCSHHLNFGIKQTSHHDSR